MPIPPEVTDIKTDLGSAIIGTAGEAVSTFTDIMIKGECDCGYVELIHVTLSVESASAGGVLGWFYTQVGGWTDLKNAVDQIQDGINEILRAGEISAFGTTIPIGALTTFSIPCPEDSVFCKNGSFVIETTATMSFAYEGTAVSVTLKVRCLYFYSLMKPEVFWSVARAWTPPAGTRNGGTAGGGPRRSASTGGCNCVLCECSKGMDEAASAKYRADVSWAATVASLGSAGDAFWETALLRDGLGVSTREVSSRRGNNQPPDLHDRDFRVK